MQGEGPEKCGKSETNIKKTVSSTLRGRPLCSQVGLASELTWVGKPALETLAKPSLHSQLEGNAEQSSDRKGGIEIYIHTWGVTIWERRGHKHPHGNSS